MTKTTRPLERVYLTAFGTETIDDGTIYTFIAVDDFSKFLFLLNTVKILDNEALLKGISDLINHADFIKVLNDDFTLVMPFGEDIIDLIQPMIKPIKGKVVFDEKVVAKHIKPVLNELGRFQ